MADTRIADAANMEPRHPLRLIRDVREVRGAGSG